MEAGDGDRLRNEDDQDPVGENYTAEKSGATPLGKKYEGRKKLPFDMLNFRLEHARLRLQPICELVLRLHSR